MAQMAAIWTNEILPCSSDRPVWHLNIFYHSKPPQAKWACRCVKCDLGRTSLPQCALFCSDGGSDDLTWLTGTMSTKLMALNSNIGGRRVKWFHLLRNKTKVNTWLSAAISLSRNLVLEQTILVVWYQCLKFLGAGHDKLVVKTSKQKPFIQQLCKSINTAFVWMYYCSGLSLTSLC